MKQVAGKLLLTGLIYIAACTKETSNTQLQKDVAGTWELSKAYVYTNVEGGVIAYAPGNGNTILFSNGAQFTKTVVNDDTTYTIKGKCTFREEDNCGINLSVKTDNSTDTYDYHITVHQDSLIMSSGSCIADAPSYIYLRKQ